MPISHPWMPSSLAKPLIVAGCNLPPRREILIIVSSSDYNFLFFEALHFWRDLALLDFLIFSTGTLETPRISAVVDRAEGAHWKPVAVTIKKRPCQKQKKKFHVDPTCARNWIEPPPGNKANPSRAINSGS